MGHSVKVDEWLQKRLPDRNWEHLDQALPPRKCQARGRSSTQEQGTSELVIPENDVRDEAALLVADGDQRKNMAHAIALTYKRREGLKKRTGDTTIEKLQLQLLFARSYLCAKLDDRGNEADILHVAVRHLFYTRDIPFTFSHQGEDASMAQDHANSIRTKNEFPEKVLAELYMFARNNEGEVKEKLDKVEEKLSELEEELEPKQARGKIEDSEEDILLWARMTMTLVLFLQGVRQCEVALPGASVSVKPAEKLKCLRAAYSCFARMRQFCVALAACTQVLLKTGGGKHSGKGWCASDLLSYRRFEFMSKLLMAMTLSEQAKLGCEGTAEVIGVLRGSIASDITKLRPQVEDLIRTKGGSVLSEVDMVGALKCIDAALRWTKQTATEEETESSEED